MSAVPLSVLDLATVSTGQDSAAALAASIRLARAADEHGYRRFWVAEHHNTVSVASTAPAVLLGAIGAATERIRLGSGGVMLPNHVPYVVAEQFALLDALYPGRIDLGLGRAPGTDPLTAAALRRDTSQQAVDEFPADVVELLGLFGDPRTAPAGGRRLLVTPDQATRPEIWMLGSSLFGAELAGRLGLPYSYANHFGMNGDPVGAAEHYRRHFEPSPALAEPYFMVSVSALTGPDPETVSYLSGPAKVMRHQIFTGARGKVIAPDEVAAYADRVADRGLFDAMAGFQLAGSAEVVSAGIDELAARTGADEVLLAGTTFDVEDRIRTLRELAAVRDPSGAGADSDA
ncbi:LLM class flavin-dependent oxidoreductase [Pseudoclavibacter chungangensis]|uniref:LLM class flavin-dependent oxidoreductase n=1 Tax=Pseudoclavibacter chungangensis TaxID=587635 RepID=A0A7J5C1R1_9MICO|nr:LLM class flavin-dependent oxidoreductase [Pseudoclavibacter chungangensis]KAB1662435.1 LLM class flavin-dependent oxidoreductase [Pseudoclavibacter chungangensis]NYJ68463.1 luciferase family oxidoreductase group 1 [Pseudoclavibacter chungangensis]